MTTRTKPRPKPGIRTSEFWLAALATALPTITASLGALGPKTAAGMAIAGAIASAAYSVARGKVKAQ